AERIALRAAAHWLRLRIAHGNLGDTGPPHHGLARLRPAIVALDRLLELRRADEDRAHVVARGARDLGERVGVRRVFHRDEEHASAAFLLEEERQAAVLLPEVDRDALAHVGAHLLAADARHRELELAGERADQRLLVDEAAADEDRAEPAAELLLLRERRGEVVGLEQAPADQQLSELEHAVASPPRPS